MRSDYRGYTLERASTMICSLEGSSGFTSTYKGNLELEGMYYHPIVIVRGA